jgi:uncharacterized protein YjgD (DUF1641 family)
MSDGKQVESEAAAMEALEAAVAENPEEVARFVARLGLVNDLLDGTAVATAGMDDTMVEELTETAATLGAAADEMATAETAQLGAAVGEHGDELAAGLETVARLEADGTLDALAELADVAALLRAAVDDKMVESLAATGTGLGEVAATAGDEAVAQGLETSLDALGDGVASDPEPVGLLGMVSALRDPEVQAGMGVLLAILRAFGGDAGE